MKIIFSLCLAIMSFTCLIAKSPQPNYQNETILSPIILEIQTSDGSLIAYRPSHDEVQRTAHIAKEIFIEAFSTSYHAYHQMSESKDPIEKWLRLKEGLSFESWLSKTFDGEFEEYFLGIKGIIYLARDDGSLVGWVSYSWNPDIGEFYLSQGSLQADTRQKNVATTFFAELFRAGKLEAAFPGIKDIKLITRKINTAARRLFTKCGFRLDEVIDPSVYGDSYDDRYIGYSLTVSS